MARRWLLVLRAPPQGALHVELLVVLLELWPLVIMMRAAPHAEFNLRLAGLKYMASGMRVGPSNRERPCFTRPG
jgi:hypothetical protein